jgi:hypothetical protein
VRPIFENAFHDGAPEAGIGGEADFVKDALEGAVAFQDTMFFATFEVEIDIKGDAGAIRPARTWRCCAAVDAIRIVAYVRESVRPIDPRAS